MTDKLSKKEKFWWSEYFAFGEKTPLFSSAIGFEEIAQILESNIKSIKQAKSPRLVILETWLILDYIIRLFIISGLNLNKFSTIDFDIVFELLPQSFEKCLKFLENFIKNQEELSPNPEKNKIDFRGKFAYFIVKEHKDFFDEQFIPILKEYYKKYYPELVDTAKTFKQIEQEKKNYIKRSFSLYATSQQIFSFSKASIPTYRKVDDNWFNIAIQFDKQWFTDVRKINGVRNISAHNIKSEKIYKGIGINGKDEKKKLQKLKKFCIQQLSKILDIYIPKKKGKKFK